MKSLIILIQNIVDSRLHKWQNSRVQIDRYSAKWYKYRYSTVASINIASSTIASISSARYQHESNNGLHGLGDHGVRHGPEIRKS